MIGLQAVSLPPPAAFGSNDSDKQREQNHTRTAVTMTLDSGRGGNSGYTYHGEGPLGHLPGHHIGAGNGGSSNAATTNATEPATAVGSTSSQSSGSLKHAGPLFDSETKGLLEDNEYFRQPHHAMGFQRGHLRGRTLCAAILLAGAVLLLAHVSHGGDTIEYLADRLTGSSLLSHVKCDCALAPIVNGRPGCFAGNWTGLLRNSTTVVARLPAQTTNTFLADRHVCMGLPAVMHQCLDGSGAPSSHSSRLRGGFAGADHMQNRGHDRALVAGGEEGRPSDTLAGALEELDAWRFQAVRALADAVQDLWEQWSSVYSSSSSSRSSISDSGGDTWSDEDEGARAATWDPVRDGTPGLAAGAPRLTSLGDGAIGGATPSGSYATMYTASSSEMRLEAYIFEAMERHMKGCIGGVWRPNAPEHGGARYERGENDEEVGADDWDIVHFLSWLRWQNGTGTMELVAAKQDWKTCMPAFIRTLRHRWGCGTGMFVLSRLTDCVNLVY